MKYTFKCFVDVSGCFPDFCVDMIDTDGRDLTLTVDLTDDEAQSIREHISQSKADEDPDNTEWSIVGQLQRELPDIYEIINREALNLMRYVYVDMYWEAGCWAYQPDGATSNWDFIEEDIEKGRFNPYNESGDEYDTMNREMLWQEWNYDFVMGMSPNEFIDFITQRYKFKVPDLSEGDYFIDLPCELVGDE